MKDLENVQQKEWTVALGQPHFLAQDQLIWLVIFERERVGALRALETNLGNCWEEFGLCAFRWLLHGGTARNTAPSNEKNLRLLIVHDSGLSRQVTECDSRLLESWR